MRSAAALLALWVASAAAASAADSAHPGRLVLDGAGAVVVAPFTGNGDIESILRIGGDRRLRVVHRFAHGDGPGSLALIGGRVFGLDGYSESGGRAFVLDGDRFRTVFRVPDDGHGTIAYDRAAPAAAGYVFAIDGGRGAACRPRKGSSPCGAIEVIGRDGHARRLETFSRPTAPLSLGGDGRAAWFGARDPARLLVVRAGRAAAIDTGGRIALDATPFGAGALIALRGADTVDVAALQGVRLTTLATTYTGASYADATLRSRGRNAYALIIPDAATMNRESRLYVLAPPAAPHLIRTWYGGDVVRLHFVDATGGAVISTETRTAVGRVTTRGALLRIRPNGAVRALSLGALGDSAAVDDAIEAPDGAVWSLLSFYGAPRGIVRSDGQSSTAFPLGAGIGPGLRKN